MSITVNEACPKGGVIAGHVATGFEGVLDAFRANFAGREVGASVCVLYRGTPVVDLWGGIADPATGREWAHDTVSIVYSCTKGATALCAHLLAEEGKLDYAMPVAELWPEFAAGGKAATTVAQMLCHTSPVPHYREPLKPGAIADWDYMVERTAAEPAWWEPGTRQGYHGLSYAWTVGNLVRLAAGEPMAAYFARKVAGPLGLDFQIGLREADEPRVAPMIASDPSEANLQSKFIQTMFASPQSLSALFLQNTGGANFNSREIHAAEIGSANGISNARGLAGMYAPLAAGGGALVSDATLHRMRRVAAATMDDAVLRQPMRFGLGFMNSTDNRKFGGDSVILGEEGFGHVGAGGSIGFADPAHGLAMGYTMNRMGAGILLNERGQALVDAVYAAIGCTSNASGAWR